MVASMPRRLVLVLLACLVGLPADAQQCNRSLYQGMRWRLIGPFRGGRTVAVSGAPGQPGVFYFGAVAGGVWKSTDYGHTWNPIFDGEPTGSVGALAVVGRPRDAAQLVDGVPHSAQHGTATDCPASAGCLRGSRSPRYRSLPGVLCRCPALRDPRARATTVTHSAGRAPALSRQAPAWAVWAIETVMDLHVRRAGSRRRAYR